MSDMVGGNLISGVTPGFEFENGNAGRMKSVSPGSRLPRKGATPYRPRADERTLRADDASK
ncbi:hypothetical protein [Magnetospirillum molischianum]|uniref:hypothetical protein n=1 Tax=Magnetospirillum molischianum TaxID=1083 RepID=UPI000304D769|nr:hypothetical protein [Magnetospirillum molischianum]